MQALKQEDHLVNYNFYFFNQCSSLIFVFFGMEDVLH